MKKDIELPHGRFYQSEDLTPTQQHDTIDLMTSLCAARVFRGMRDMLLDTDPDFVKTVFADLNLRAIEADRMMMTEADISEMGRVKRRVRKTLEELLVRLPEYKSLVAVSSAAPNQGNHKEIVSSKAFELILSYVLERKENEARKACPVELTHHGYMIGIAK